MELDNDYQASNKEIQTAMCGQVDIQYQGFNDLEGEAKVAL